MKKWVWYLIGAIVLALAGGGVLYGVLTHKEPGLMKVCWSGGKALYDAQCTTELKWSKDRIPIPYYIDFDKNHTDYVESVTSAADLWNKEIGTALFIRVTDPGRALTTVSWGSLEPGKQCAAGSTSHTGNDTEGVTGAAVVLREPSDVHAVYRFAVHEFGHVLGLDHDEAKRSIMYPKQPETTQEMTFVLPSDFDKKLLQELYR